jgi:aminomethyltransferase
MRHAELISKDHYKTNVYPSPFHSRTEPLNKLKRWNRWGDYLSAAAYYDSSLEYFACRNTCGVFDLSSMVKHRITGPDALEFMNRLVTRDVSRIGPKRVGYAVWCNEQGQVLDDGTIFHLRENDYRLCSQEHHIDWLLTNAYGMNVSVVEDTHDIAALALQGPTSCATLKSMGLDGIETLKPFGIEYYPFEGAELMVSRTGFTGDLGYELWTDHDHAGVLWDRLFEAGALHGIKPIGEEALGLLRIEAGFIQARHDFMPANVTVRATHTRSPFELGLEWLVHFHKPLFNGRRALLEEKERGSRYQCVRLDIEGNKPARDAYIYKGKKVIGAVTSAMWSPSAKASIALASVDARYGNPGEQLKAEIFYRRELQWSRVMARATVVKDAFFDPPRKKMTPPPDC